MENILLLLVSIIPVLIIGIYIYVKDRNKEPISILIKLFLGGIASVIIVLLVTIVMYQLFPSLTTEAILYSDTIGKLFKIFVSIAIIEEGSKWLMAYLISYNSKHFDEYYDIVLYCVFIALGFACVENILYVFQGGVKVGLLRIFTAVPAHCFFGVLMGEYLGLAKLNHNMGNIKKKRLYIALSILLPTIMHWLYDFFAFESTNYSIILFFTTLIFGYLISIDKIKRISSYETVRYHDNYCTNCGSKVDGNYCSSCGKKCI